MAASRLDPTSLSPSVIIDTPQRRFSLPASAIRLRSNGVEFLSPECFPVWAEMTVSLQPPGTPGRIRATGVVVACDGNRHQGYSVSLLFLNLSRVSQERLRALVQGVAF